jgi:hypothetical protein
VSFGEGDSAPRREVRLTRRCFPNGGEWTLYLCPACGGLAHVLRLFAGEPKCRRCLLRHGLRYRIDGGLAAERAEARERRVERLRAMLDGGPLRLNPLPGRVLDRRASLQASLARALASRWDGLR